MTRFRSLLTSGLSALALLAAQSVYAADYVVAVPQALTPDEGRQIHQDLLAFVMERAAAGDVIRVVDATAIDTIATFTIPDGSAALIANLRQRALAPALQDWGRFVSTHYVDAPGPDADSAGQILLPQLLTHLATQTYADLPVDDRQICVLVLGSALYRDPREPDFAMTEGRFPSDGLIVTSQSRSPYGTADRQGQLRGFYVNMLALDQNWASDLHQLRVERLWSLFLKAQGGTLATFTADPATALDRFVACEHKPGRSFDWDSTRNLEAMITADRITDFGEVIPQPVEIVAAPEVVSEVPDETGRFGHVIRIEESAFLPTSGMIGFDEFRLGTRNPVYRPEDYGAAPDGLTVSFGGYFLGQRPAIAAECAPGAVLSGCVAGTPSVPLRLDPSAPAVMSFPDGSNPDSPSLTGSPSLNGPVTMVFDQDVAGVGLMGGYFNNPGSIAIRVFDRQGHLIGGVTNIGVGMEYLALVTDDGSERIAGLQFSLIGDEPAGFAIDNLRIAASGQIIEGQLPAMAADP